jgi:hypothetical protein
MMFRRRMKLSEKREEEILKQYKVRPNIKIQRPHQTETIHLPSKKEILREICIKKNKCLRR